MYPNFLNRQNYAVLDQRLHVLETRQDLGADPVRQARMNLLAPLFLLTLACRQWRIRITHQIGGDGTDVVSQATSSEKRRMTP